MPIAFENCIKNGGKVITKSLNAKQYIHVCYIGGKSFIGEVKEKQNANTGKGKK